jgi:hypothetical protein
MRKMVLGKRETSSRKSPYEFLSKKLSCGDNKEEQNSYKREPADFS